MKRVKKVVAALAVTDADDALIQGGTTVIRKKNGNLCSVPFFEVQGKTMEAKRLALHAHVDDLFMAVCLEKDVAKHTARLKPKG